MNELKFIIRQRNQKKEQTYLDFKIDEKSLIDYLKLGNMDLISPFGWGDNENYEIQLLKEFRVEILPTLDSGRVMFYVCPECGDISCGAITGLVSENERGQIEWSDFGYENDYQGVVEKYANISFCFERTDYFRAFEYLQNKL